MIQSKSSQNYFADDKNPLLLNNPNKSNLLGVSNYLQTNYSTNDVKASIKNKISMLKQKQEGYSPEYFVHQVNKDLLCPICNKVVKRPRECIVCGNMFCEYCIKQWAEQNNKISYIHISPKSKHSNYTCLTTIGKLPLNYLTNNNNSLLNHGHDINSNYIITECPMKCKSNYNLKESLFKPIGKVVKNILYQLEIKCPNPTCEKVFSLDKYEEHEFYCFLPKCQNVLCGKGIDKQVSYKADTDPDEEEEKKFCSDNCKFSFIFQQQSTKLFDKKDEMTLWFHSFLKNSINENIHLECEKRISNLKEMVKAVSGEKTIVINDNDYSSGITAFKWDVSKKGQGIQVFNNGEGLLLHESCYAFRTIVGCTPFNSGVHYWEIIADRRTENELKIGVTRNINFNYDTSFSDYNFGYAFYGIGQLRHSNNASGESYGKKFKKQGVLGVFLDMNRGVLSFALDGEYYGLAFQSDDLKLGPIWPAISLLHVAGCTLQTGIPSPPYFFNDY